MARPVAEWIAKHHGVNIPPRVRLRVYDAHEGICYLCRLPIKPGETWQADHVVALINGGEHRESNLAPAHSHCHVGKTARDVAEKSKVARVRQKHTGTKRPSSSLATRNKRQPKRLTKELPPRVRDVFGRPAPKEANTDV